MNFENGLPLLYTLLALGVLTSLSVFALAAAGRLFGVRVLDIKVGYGATLMNLMLGRAKLTLAPIPLGGSVQFADNRYKPYDGDPKEAMDSKPALVRFLISSLTFLYLLLFGLLVFGAGVFALMGDAIPQMVKGALSPTGYARELLGDYVEMFRSEGALRAIALAATKLGTVMLVPFSPVLGMGQALVSMLKDPVNSRLVERWSVFATLLGLAFFASWGWAAVTFAFAK